MSTAEKVQELAQAKAFLGHYRTQADARLGVLLAEREGRLAKLPFGTARYYAHLREYALRGGKRLRGALVQLGYQAATGRDPAPVLDASLSFELVHAAFLAFDDIMDRDELRRGGKALHVLSAEEAARAGARDAVHRGLSVTILLANLAQAVSYDLIVRAPAYAGEALGWFNEVVEGVNVGQLLDVCAADAPEAPAQAVAVIHQLKTGLYTTEGPLVLGALLAGASAEKTERLRAYARPLGEAFQLVDDLLGAVGEAAETGKAAASDLREGKRTAVIEEALALLTGGAREELRALVGRPLGAAEAETARALLVRSGAVESVRARARALADEACGALDERLLDPSACRVLRSLALLVVERQN